MTNLLDALCMHDVPAVMLTVARIEGSAPREAGAKMLVTQHAQFGTVGGGHLEMRACEMARAMLEQCAPSVTANRHIVRFALGPGLGQCCGGVVHLVFECIDQTAQAHFRRLYRYRRERRDVWRVVALDTNAAPALYDRAGNCIGESPHTSRLQFNRSQPCHVMQDSDGHRWLIDPCLPYRPHLLLFGAGHVGTAIVQALADLPCHVTWIDAREEMFPDKPPANVIIEATDIPEAMVDHAPGGSCFLVLTHSHALDQRLSEHILRRTDVAWFGLIGSRTKRLQFEHRLRERGIPPERLADMVCPIGLPGIAGKTPAIIAASVCAQLLMVWETIERGHVDISHTEMRAPEMSGALPSPSPAI